MVPFLWRLVSKMAFWVLFKESLGERATLTIIQEREGEPSWGDTPSAAELLERNLPLAGRVWVAVCEGWGRRIPRLED